MTNPTAESVLVPAAVCGLSEQQIYPLYRYGADILDDPRFLSSDAFVQHGDVSVLKHSILVALTALSLARALRIPVNKRDMVRGALLHDFFLYDWHTEGKRVHIPFYRFYRLHGFAHPGIALANARRFFSVNRRQQDIIAKHMFPLTPIPPKCREAWLVSLADKLCALRETFRRRSFVPSAA